MKKFIDDLLRKLLLRLCEKETDCLPTLITYWSRKEIEALKLDEEISFRLGGEYGPITTYTLCYIGNLKQKRIYQVSTKG